MKSLIQFVGIDVDDKAYHVAVVDREGSEVLKFVCAPTPETLLKKFKTLKLEVSSLRLCYEASYVGFSLYRSLKEKGIFCAVIAPSLIPKVAGHKVKTDKLDSLKLAVYFSKGLLTEVTVPTEEHEAERSLVRTRSFLIGEIKAYKNKLNALCRQFGWDFKRETGLKSLWTAAYRDWLEKKIAVSVYPEIRTSFRCLLSVLCSSESQLKTLDERIETTSKKAKNITKVKALKCIRGISTHTAMTLISEIGDIRRFKHPKSLTSYAGLDVVEHSSGGRERKYGISKAGNAHIRKVLGEACQFAPTPPRISRDLRMRRREAEEQYIKVADKCMNRLHSKSISLLFKGKAKNKVKIACAREMLTFVWEALTMAA